MQCLENCGPAAEAISALTCGVGQPCKRRAGGHKCYLKEQKIARTSTTNRHKYNARRLRDRSHRASCRLHLHRLLPIARSWPERPRTFTKRDSELRGKSCSERVDIGRERSSIHVHRTMVAGHDRKLRHASLTPKSIAQIFAPLL